MFDVTFFGAAFAGLLSFLSPCILPIVPFYLSYLAGVGISEISDEADLSPKARRRIIISALLFSAGIITIFMAFGATASILGQFVRDYMDILRWAAAAVIIVMGLHFLGVIKIAVLYRQFSSNAGDTSKSSYIGAYVIGLAFAFGWTPCVGPVLAAILFMAAGSETAGSGMGLLLAYGLGMTLPFILAAMFVGPFMKQMAKFRKHLPKIEKAMGVLLIVFGILIATNSISYIAQWMLEVGPDIGVLR
ncbi:MAG: cytochrome c biogenesis CcdA family protein [Paracoccaceae bacterium]